MLMGSVLGWGSTPMLEGENLLFLCSPLGRWRLTKQIVVSRGSEHKSEAHLDYITDDRCSSTKADIRETAVRLYYIHIPSHMSPGPQTRLLFGPSCSAVPVIESGAPTPKNKFCGLRWDLRTRLFHFPRQLHLWNVASFLTEIHAKVILI